MERNLFISHSSYDKKVVEVLADLIRIVSSNKINIWFSSDNEIDGGFMVGDSWFGTILNQLRKSQVVLSFITPNSNNKPWILFESGFGEANGKVIPLKFLMNTDIISPPFQQKQIFGIYNIEETKVFLSKLLDEFGLDFNKTYNQEIIKDSLNKMRCYFTEIDNKNEIKDDICEKLSRRLDGYFDIMMKIIQDKKSSIEYEIPISFVNQNQNQVTKYFKINDSLRFNDILDCLYYVLNGKVGVYKYLETWILKEKGSNRYAVISDVQDLIPAMCIFRPGTKWMVEFLAEPYMPDNLLNSKNITRMDSIGFYYDGI